MSVVIAVIDSVGINRFIALVRSNRRKILAVTTQLKQLRKESLKKKKKFGSNGIRTHDLCDAGAVL